MPIYDFYCRCGWEGERSVPIDERDRQHCPACGKYPMDRHLAAPLGRIAGRAVQGGGPDRFTADMLGVPLKELPEGLKTR